MLVWNGCRSGSGSGLHIGFNGPITPIGVIGSSGGGGNIGNTITAMSRLGADCSMITEVGSDGNGSAIVDELKSEGIDCDHVFVGKDMPSAFSYVLQLHFEFNSQHHLHLRPN